MSLKIDGVAGKGVDARIERGKSGQGAEDELAIMHHAVGVAGRRVVKLCIGLRLESFAYRCGIVALGNRGEGSDYRKDQ